MNLIDDNKKSKEAKQPNSIDEASNLPYWSTIHSNQAFPYVPQLKDTVVYFPTPHLEFIRRNGRKLKEKLNFDDILPNNKPFFEGLIEELEFVPDDIVKCKITLKLLIGRKSTKIQFHYFFGINQPNFIILKTAYESNNDTKFKLNETVKIRIPPCQDENGIILDIKDDQEALVYKVLW